MVESKRLSLFGVSIDELISDEDVESKKLQDDKRAKKYYYLAVAFLGLTVLAALGSYLGIPYVSILTLIGVIGYLSCALLAKPRYKRIEAKKYITAYVISRVIVLVIVVMAMVYTISTL